MNRLEELTRNFFSEPDLSNFSNHSILVALSGGPDSVALMDVMDRIGISVVAAHVNYRLRKEADEEAELVQKWCAERGWTCHIRTVNPNLRPKGSSIQAWARAIRYQWFEELLQSHQYAALATGHHQQDRVETLLMSLLRGGAKGILNDLRRHHKQLIRPFYDVPKAEIDAYLEQHQLPFVLDSSNFKNDYLRNQIRLDLLPLLHKVNPSVENRILAFSEDLRQRHALITEFFRPIVSNPNFVERKENGITIYTDRFSDTAFSAHFPQDHPRNATLFLEHLVQDIGFFGNEVQRITELVTSHPGAIQVMERVEGRWEVLRIKGGIQIRWEESLRSKERFAPLKIDSPNDLPPDWIRIGRHRIKFRVEAVPKDLRPPRDREEHLLDPQSVQWPLVIRPWQEGDRMQPFGMRGSKLLSDIFGDLGTPLNQRQEALVFEDAGGHIVLVSGFRIAEPVRVQSESREVLRIGIDRL